MLFQYRRTVRRVTRWFLRHRNKSLSISESIALYQETFIILSEQLASFMHKDEMEALVRVAKDLTDAGIPKEIANRVSQLSTLFSTMDIAEISKENNCTIEQAANLYFKLGARLELHWFLDQITRQGGLLITGKHWLELRLEKSLIGNNAR